MKKKILLCVIIIITFSKSYADYGHSYFFKCKLTTTDTTLHGYIQGLYIYLIDSTIQKFRENDDFFKRELIKHLKEINQTDLTLYEYVYICSFGPRKVEDIALYISENKCTIDLDDIIDIEYKDIVDFDMIPNSVISEINEQDTLWIESTPILKIEDKEVDPCCPQQFLIFDDKVDYQQIINEVIRHKDFSEEREKLTAELRKYKILALRICWCG